MYVFIIYMNTVNFSNETIYNERKENSVECHKHQVVKHKLQDIDVEEKELINNYTCYKGLVNYKSNIGTKATLFDP